MSLVELRNQKRLETIRMIRGLLLKGDMIMIAKLSGKSYRSVSDTLNEKHPLYSPAVITAAIQYLKEKGRIDQDYSIAELC